MTWTYSQSTGRLSHDGEVIATGYAGHDAGLDDPSAQQSAFVGPLPQGTYDIGPPMSDGGHMGPYVLPLGPWPINNMFGRSGFYIHGDTPARDQSAHRPIPPLCEICRATCAHWVIFVVGLMGGSDREPRLPYGNCSSI